ncbi:hypothetical protein FP2506_02180 [Fulvimarina pelagi HTCC2506]|uniref:Uncharacterized protein n=2 Tax=Fulvimarina pelagi TaxID=217511 RepID=Q0FYI4_9HYPH|nr:hypothetical protein [Fulvimarina pelagi]EAU40011.1 hypothetical protein FP2506_02180 [Fulvimarina pelagi HTCC2506]BAT31053.1 hypothetical protein [Fulvimarina pelagi]
MAENRKTETVTKTGPRAPSNLHDGMPIADKRVALGKGAGKWLLVGFAILIVAALFFVGSL